MSFAQWLIYAFPTWLIGVVMCLIAIAISVGGVLLVRRFVDVKTLKGHHDIAGPIFATLGVIYAVLLAFIIIVVWQDFDRTNNNVTSEATAYSAIYRDTAGFPEPFKSRMRAAMDDYINTVIKDEWPLLARGEGSDLATQKAVKVWEVYASFNPQTETEKAFYSESLSRMNNAVELRRQRLMDARKGIHPVLWMVLLLGGIITIVFTFFFGSENLRAQLIMTTLLAVLITLILFTILVMDYPFTGDINIQPDALQMLLKIAKI